MRNKMNCILFAIQFFLLKLVQSQSNAYVSPCPQIFTYDSTSLESGKWYGTILVRSDVTLYGLWIDIIFDRTTESVENSLGDVTKSNNREFKLENKDMILSAGTSLSVRISAKYDASSVPPRIKILRLNGIQICSATVTNSAQSQTVSQNRRNVDQYSTANRNPSSIYANTRTENEALPLGASNSYSNKQKNNPILSSEVVTLKSFTRSFADFEVSAQPSSSKRFSTSRNAAEDINNIGSIDTRNVRENRGEINYRETSNSRPSSTNYETIYSNPAESQDRRTTNDRSINRQPTTNNRRTYQTTTTTTTESYRIKSDPDEYDYADSAQSSHKRKNNNDYFEGDFRLPPESKIYPTPLPRRDNSPPSCGKVAVQPAPLVVGGQTTAHGQWPWHVALYQTQTVDNKYICGGSLVTTTHVLTAAHCVTRKSSSRIVNAQTLTVYLGKYNLRKSSDSVQIKLVRRIFVHPEYNSTNFYADLAVLKLTKPCDYTTYVRPVCLWKDTETDLSNIIGKDGTVVGWGFDGDGHVTEELTLVKMPVVRHDTCLWSFREFYTYFTSEKSFCAGFENGTSVCNGDSGGGMVFPDNDDRDATPTWRLRGLVSISVAKQNEYRCDPYHYVVFTDIAQFLNWIKDKIAE